jgi:hypothetical protein
MDSIRFTFRATAVTLLIGWLWAGASVPWAKDSPAPDGITLEKVADYVHAVLEADRMILGSWQEIVGASSSVKRDTRSVIEA